MCSNYSDLNFPLIEVIKQVQVDGQLMLGDEFSQEDVIVLASTKLKVEWYFEVDK